MTDLLLLAAGSAAPAHLDPIKLFRDADIVVQVVMAGLVLASIGVWTIIFSFSWRMGALRRRTAAYERDFWQAQDIDRFQAEKSGGRDLPIGKVVSAALGEWRRSANGKVDREGARQRLATAMGVVVAQEADELAGRLTFLATVGSVAPFVGLFGTVWGIMNSFVGISH
ncbi:MAG TPA: MotA/TolQ/ExbB proton channel family protein, partial [Novosphingobium sp.]|nr:MotA/TolQ/ExbB proton channel family protein [Novosphingobium sp.]